MVRYSRNESQTMGRSGSSALDRCSNWLGCKCPLNRVGNCEHLLTRRCCRTMFPPLRGSKIAAKLRVIDKNGSTHLAVPDFQSLMLPLLKFSADGKEHTMQEARDGLAKVMGLSEDDLRERLPSGRQTTYANRVAWAKVYLTQAGVLESPKRG